MFLDRKLKTELRGGHDVGASHRVPMLTQKLEIRSTYLSVLNTRSLPVIMALATTPKYPELIKYENRIRTH